jgi:hypothetical protein
LRKIGKNYRENREICKKWEKITGKNYISQFSHFCGGSLGKRVDNPS